MGSVVVIMIIIVGIGSIVWWRRRRGYASTAAALPEDKPRENGAHKAFAHGNKVATKGEYDYAATLFKQCVLGDPANPLYVKAFVDNIRLGSLLLIFVACKRT